jgi:ABC transporter substrate binding protein
MKRRDFLALLGGAAVEWPSVALAQQASKAKRLSIFSPSEPVALIQENSDNRYYRALFDELRRLRHVEGQNLTIERYAKEQNTAGPAALVAEVVRNNPDVVYVVGPSALEFKVQTAIIPIVGLTGDPLALGLVQSLAHPGGNVTGVSVDTGPSIHGKRIELLRAPKSGIRTNAPERTGSDLLPTFLSRAPLGRCRPLSACRGARGAVAVALCPTIDRDRRNPEAVFSTKSAGASRLKRLNELVELHQQLRATEPMSS